MPSFYKGRKLKVRKAFPREDGKENYLEVTIPAILRGNVVNEGDLVTPYFDGVIIYAPEGKTIDIEKMKEAIIDVDVEDANGEKSEDNNETT